MPHRGPFGDFDEDDDDYDDYSDDDEYYYDDEDDEDLDFYMCVSLRVHACVTTLTSGPGFFLRSC